MLQNFKHYKIARKRYKTKKSGLLSGAWEYVCKDPDYGGWYITPMPYSWDNELADITEIFYSLEDAKKKLKYLSKKYKRLKIIEISHSEKIV